MCIDEMSWSTKKNNYKKNTTKNTFDETLDETLELHWEPTEIS